VRKAVAENCADEEGVGSPDGRSHAELWMDFAAGVGGSERDLQSRRPVKEMLELIASFRRIAREGSSAEALAAFYAYESQVRASPRKIPRAEGDVRSRFQDLPLLHAAHHS